MRAAVMDSDFSDFFLDRTPHFHYNTKTSQNRPSGHGTAMAFNRLLKSACLLRFPHPSPFNVPESTPRGSGFRGPCIQTFLNSLDQ
jgi:hypothetical protein